MKEFNMKQWLIESKSGMYSKTLLNEHQLEDSWTLGKEIAKAHPELIRYEHDGETKKFQDAIFKYAGEMLRDAGVSLNMVRGLAMDEDWAMELVTAVSDGLENSEKQDMPGFSGTHDALDKISIRKEINPATLGAPQAAADAQFDKEEDQDNIAYQKDAEMEESAISAPINKVVPAETGLSKYLDTLHAHDWFHHFSDDHRIWQRGQADKDNLKALYSTLAPNDKQEAMDAFIEKYLQVYNPKEFPGAANNVKYLTTDTFKGAI